MGLKLLTFDATHMRGNFIMSFGDLENRRVLVLYNSGRLEFKSAHPKVHYHHESGTLLAFSTGEIWYRPEKERMPQLANQAIGQQKNLSGCACVRCLFHLCCLWNEATLNRRNFF